MAIKKINTDLQVEAGLRDGDGDLGTNNQVLISTGTGINWVDGSGTGIIGGPYLPLAGGTMTGTGQIVMPDNFELRAGADSDLRIYHNGTNNFILNTVGNLNIRNTADDGNITFQSDDAEKQPLRSPWPEIFSHRVPPGARPAILSQPPRFEDF